MKKVYLSILSLAVCCVMNAQVAVTLNVDLSGETVSPNGVHIAGNFGDITNGLPNWNPGIEPGPGEPDPIVLTDDDMDEIYSVTLQLLPGYYSMKFVNGNAWGADETGIPAACNDGGGNRELIVGTTPMTKTFLWNGCGAQGEKIVRYSVDMSTQSAVNPNGVSVGFPNDEILPLYDFDDNNIWQAYYSVDPDATSLNFRYINGNEWEHPAEDIAGDCGTAINGIGYRDEDILETNNALTAYCFNQCILCTPATTFRVNMSQQTVGANGVFIAGGFASAGYPNWAADGLQMTDADGDDIYEITLNLPSGTYPFKFVNSGSWETVPGACTGTGGADRTITIAGASAITYTACYNQCTEACVSDPNPADITFSVNMSNVTIDPEGPRLIGSFTNPGWQAGQIIMQESAVAGIWYTTVTVSGAAEISYKFVNGLAVAGAEANSEFDGLKSVDCAEPNGFNGHNRIHVRSGVAETLTTPCFGTCEICGTIISVEETDVVNGLLVYPNPVEDLMNISFSNPVAQKITINVFNNMGQQVVAKDLGTISGQRVTTLNTADLATGIYTLAISNGVKNQIVRISVK